MTEFTRDSLSWLRQPINLFLALCSLIPLGIVVGMVESQAYSFPTMDQWTTYEPLFGLYSDSMVDVAIKVQNHTLTVEDLFYQHTVHRPFFTKLITALLSLTTHWQMKLEVYATVLFQCIAVLLVVALIRRHHRQFTGVILLIAAALFLAIRLDAVWRTGLMTQWSLVNLFVLLLVWVLFTFSIRWRVVVAAAILAWCSTFSLAPGLAVWPVGIAALWLRGYRKPLIYLFWLAAAAATVGLYFSGYDFGATGTRGSVFDPSVFGAMLGLLSTPFVPIDGTMTDFGMILSVVGGLFLAVNALYLWRRGYTLVIAPWLILALYVVGGAFLAGLGRFPAGSRDLVRGRYGTMMNYFWLALILLMILACWHIWKNRSSNLLKSILLRGNVILGAGLVGLFILANAPMIYANSSSYQVEEACLYTDPIDLKGDCTSGLLSEGPEFYRRVRDLAKYRLSLFQTPPVLDALRSYSGDSPIIIEAPQAWPHVHIQDRFPPEAHIDPDRVLHVLDPAPEADIAAVLGAEAHYVAVQGDAERRAAVEAFTAGADTVWYIRVDNASVEDFFEANFGIVQHQAAYEDPYQPIATTEYRRLQHLYAFGDAIELNRWQMNDSVEVRACQEVHLTTEWYAVQPVPQIYSMTMVLADSQGVGVSRQDGNPGDVLTKQWQPGWVYQDERTLSIPCDLPPGEYPLLIGLYDFESLEALLVTATDSAPVGDQLYLTTLVVQG